MNALKYFVSQINRAVNRGILFSLHYHFFKFDELFCFFLQPQAVFNLFRLFFPRACIFFADDDAKLHH